MSAFTTARHIPASPQAVFAAIAGPQRLARWWGPAGFTNTVEACDFTPGGTWSYVMHGPDGKHFRNESVFEAIESPSDASPGRVVVRHVSKPHYRLTITLTPAAGGTDVAWVQAFDDPEIARRIERIVVPANEQNLDRLTAEVAAGQGGG